MKIMIPNNILMSDLIHKFHLKICRNHTTKIDMKRKTYRRFKNISLPQQKENRPRQKTNIQNEIRYIYYWGKTSNKSFKKQKMLTLKRISKKGCVMRIWKAPTKIFLSVFYYPKTSLLRKINILPTSNSIESKKKDN